MLRGMAGSQALGNPRVVMPGQKENRYRGLRRRSAVPIRLQEGQTQGGPAPVHRQPAADAARAGSPAPT